MTSGTPSLISARLRLDALTADDANTMVSVLADPTMYRYTGGEPPTLADLQRRYTALAAGSGDPDETWHNWIIRLQGSFDPIGFVQATVYPDRAEVAWTVQTASQRQGFAAEASLAMVDWLRTHRTQIDAYIHPQHAGSQRIAEILGLTRTGAVDEDGEEIWSTAGEAIAD